VLLKEGLSERAVEEISKRKGEPAWMREKRLESWKAFKQIPMPTQQDEEWRRTDISTLKLEEIIPFATPGYRAKSIDELPEELQEMIGVEQDEEGGLIVQHNSEAVYQQFTEDLARKGVIFTDMETAVREHAELVQNYFLTECLNPMDRKFVALNGALWSGGTFLYVPRGVEVTLPLRTLFWLDVAGLGAFPHTLIIAEPNSQVTYIEECGSASNSEQMLNCGVAEVYLKDGAQVRCMSLQNFGPQVFNLTTHRAIVGRDSFMIWNTAHMGSRLAKSYLESILKGSGSTTEIVGLFFADQTQHLDLDTLQDHAAPHTTSELLLKGVIRDRARTVYQGLIRVHKDAQGTDAYQANRNLLLSDQAHADSIPSLEIENNEVRCTHGATVGQIDEEHLFYLMTRGLTRKEATKIMIDGFFMQVIERIPLPTIQEKLAKLIEEKVER